MWTIRIKGLGINAKKEINIKKNGRDGKDMQVGKRKGKEQKGKK